MVWIVLAGCTSLFEKPFPFDFKEFTDGPIPPEAAKWLKAGEQTVVTPLIAEEAAKIPGRNRRERLFRAMRHVWSTFFYDSCLNPDMFTRSADELFRSRKMGDCSDYALVQLPLFRALGIPTRLVMTASLDWMKDYKMDRLAITTGHSFLEVFLEDRWYLVDPTFRFFFLDYNPGRKNFPRKMVYYKSGRDFWALGIRGTSDLNRAFRKFALEHTLDYVRPVYPSTKI